MRCNVVVRILHVFLKGLQISVLGKIIDTLAWDDEEKFLALSKLGEIPRTLLPEQPEPELSSFGEVLRRAIGMKSKARAAAASDEVTSKRGPS